MKTLITLMVALVVALVVLPSATSAADDATILCAVRTLDDIGSDMAALLSDCSHQSPYTKCADCVRHVNSLCMTDMMNACGTDVIPVLARSGTCHEDPSKYCL